MIDVYKDVFVRLALSAKRLRTKDLGRFQDSAARVGTVSRPVPAPKVMPIEDTVEYIMHNPEIIKLKKELETVEELFENLKTKGENLDYLMRLESRITRLRQLLEEKSF